MNCCLWLNGIKIRRAEEIKNNFDIASLRGYFSGGSLVRWLLTNGGEKEARRLEQTAYCENLTLRIEYAFGFSKKPINKKNHIKFYEFTQTQSQVSSGYKVYGLRSQLLNSQLNVNDNSQAGSSYIFYGSGSYFIGGSGSCPLGGYGLHII